MKEKDKIKKIKKLIKDAKKQTEPKGSFGEGTRLTYKAILEYIEFMLTPCKEDD